MDLFLHIIINNLKKLYTVSKSQAIEFPIFNRFKIDLTDFTKSKIVQKMNLK